MVHNLNLSQDAHFNHVIETVKAGSGSGKLRNSAELSPDIFLSVDPGAEIRGSYESGSGGVVSVAYEVTGTARPRWIAVHFRLGEVDLTGKAVVGIIVKSQAPNATACRVCLRTNQDGSFEDEFFAKNIVSYQEASTHLDLLKVDDLPVSYPLEKARRDLILFLPPTGGNISISDIRLFIA